MRRRTHRSIPAVLLPILSTAMASSSAPSDLPQVDFSKMGAVGLGGSFQGLDFWSSSSPFASSSNSSSSSRPPFSSNGDTLFLQSSDGSYTPLGNTNAGGTITTLCLANSTSGNGTIYLGGSFSSLSGVPAANIASFSLSTNTFSALSSGLSGTVQALYCDNANSEVWAGGLFSSHVAVWSTSSSTWGTLPFSNLNGPVTTISASSNGSSLYFGGNFTTAFASNSSANATYGNITSVPSVNSSVATVGHSGFLTPLTIPYTEYSDPDYQISVTGSPGTSQSLYRDPNVLLCPGEGIWLAQDNSAGTINVVGYNFLIAQGIRLVNGLIEGRGTKSFSLVAQPSGQQLELTYTNPSTGQNATCTTSCPLSTNSSVTAMDFAFTAGTQNLTGMQLQLNQWIGDGPGLSSIQLLSDGAFASAVPSINKPLCPGDHNSSSVQYTDSWTVQTYRATNPSTATYYLATNVSSSNLTYPAVTFYPYVSAAADYNVYMVIPGCTKIGDCASRTSVDVEVLPVQGGLGFSSTISEQVQDDTMTLIYSGPVDGTSGSFTPTIKLALAQNPAAPTDGTTYTVVAEAVDMFLIGVSSDGTATNTSRQAGQAVNGTRQISNTTLAVSFGLYEYDRNAPTVNAASVLPNSSENALSNLGFALDMAYNLSSSPDAFVVNALLDDSGTVYVAGAFSVSSNYSNVVSLDPSTGKSTPLADKGLDGVVYAIANLGGEIYFGGNFTHSAGGATALNRLAKWDPKGQAWSALGGGVDGPVTSLSVLSTNVLVLGNFSNVLDSSGTATATGGYAVWDTSKSTWDTSGVLFGNLSSAAVVTTSNGAETILAGKVGGVSANAVDCVAMLSTGSNGQPTISSLTNVDFASSGSASSSSPARRRSIPVAHIAKPRGHNRFFARLADPFVRRSILARDTAPIIPATNASAPAVLAGAFWTNSSASGKPTVYILGGIFSSGSVEGVGFYANQASSPDLTGPSPPVTGLVKTLNVVDDKLYVGGAGVNVTGVGSDLVIYDLSKNAWVSGTMSGLTAASGSSVIVNTIKTRTNTNTAIVGGNFAKAGSLTCNAVCLWDVQGSQWSTPGNGLSSGEVRAVDFAGDNYELLIVAGSFVLASGDVSYVATFSFDNSTWTGLGTLPGPALAVAVDNKNSTNIFAAGYSSSDNTPYLQQWNGNAWTTQNSSLLPGSLVSQLAFVPLTQDHTAEGSIEQDRMLMVSGDLYLDDTGNATSALFDGAMMHPYLVATTSSGALGTATSLFWSQSTFSFAIRHFLATGLVVLVAIAIATGLILLLILLFFLVACVNRRRERNKPPPQDMFEKEGSEVSSTHQHVFNNVQAALEQSLLSPHGPNYTTAGLAPVVIGKGSNNGSGARRRSDPSDYGTADAGTVDGDEEDEGRETTMRYDFDGPELQPGEMSMKAGLRVVILDDVQSHEWWYARDPATGREGVVPATYVW